MIHQTSYPLFGVTLLFLKLFISVLSQVSFSSYFPKSLTGAANCLRVRYQTWSDKVGEGMAIILLATFLPMIYLKIVTPVLKK